MGGGGGGEYGRDQGRVGGASGGGYGRDEGRVGGGLSDDYYNSSNSGNNGGRGNNYGGGRNDNDGGDRYGREQYNRNDNNSNYRNDNNNNGGNYNSSNSGNYRNDNNNDNYRTSDTSTSNISPPKYGIQSDFDEVRQEADQRAEAQKNSKLFDGVLSMITGQAGKMIGGGHGNDDDGDLDEDDARRQYDSLYNDCSTHNQGQGQGHQQASSKNVGLASAMSALKMFSDGGSSSGGSHGGHGSDKGSSSAQDQFIRLAMSQAASMFDKQSAQGKTAPGANKEDAVSAAARMAMKMYVKHQMGAGGSSSGGNNASSSGGMGGLLNMASKFL